MTKLKKLTSTQLNKMINETKAELKRRENSNAATLAKPRDHQRSVKAKYKNPDGTATWTGRGRTPLWVNGICERNGLDLDSFKKDAQFRC